MKTATLFTVAILGMFSLGCQKSDINGNAPVNIGGACNNCQTIAQEQPLLESVQAQTQGQEILLSLQVYGKPAMGCMQPINKQIICAQGMGSISGIMRVQNGQMFCGIPNGDYTIQPTQASQLSNATISGGLYQAIGPGGYRLVLNLQNGILYNPSGLDLFSRENRIGLNASVTRADGASCGWLSTN